MFKNSKSEDNCNHKYAIFHKISMASSLLIMQILLYALSIYRCIEYKNSLHKNKKLFKDLKFK